MKKEKLDVRHSSGALDIVYTWRSASAYFLLFFTLVWNLAIGFFLFMGAGIAVVFHLLVGVLIGWYALALLLNKSRIRVDGRELTVHHGPLPTLQKSRSVPRRAIEQIVLATGGRQKSGTKTKTLYNVVAQLDTGAEVKLLSRVDDYRLAKRVERELEKFLGIRDVPHDEGQLKLPDLSRLKEIMPAGLRGSVEELEQRMGRQLTGNGDRGPGTHGDRSAAPPELELPNTTARPRPLPEPPNAYGYHLYSARVGDDFRIVNAGYTIKAATQIDWQDNHQPTARELEVSPLAHGEPRCFYAEVTRERWIYYEERILEADEVARLGFTPASHPLSFANGDDKYYPRDLQVGVRFTDGYGRDVEQHVYFTTRSTAQFRAIRPTGGAWEVYVQEPVDAGIFEEREA